MIIIRIDGNLKDYDDFVDDIADKVAERATRKDKREFISQRKACEMCGRRNVERWRQEGKIQIYRRPGKVEYKIADLRRLLNTEQDYYRTVPKGKPNATDDDKEK